MIEPRRWEPNEVFRSFNKSARTAAALVALVTSAVLADGLASGGARAQGNGYDDAAGEVDLDTFYRELAPYGDWFTHPRWGTVWRPHVDQDWRPYTRGHWANSEEHGWIWVAEEEWGWAAFHYGRWTYDDDEDEWLWIPGTEWAPAWVMWRQSDDVVGWAPLPPDAVWEPGYGLRFNASIYEGPRYYSYWSFVQPEHMFVPGLHRHLLPRDRYRSFWGSTYAVRDHHRLSNGRIYHRGIDRGWVERHVGRPVPLVTLRSVRNPRDQGWRHSRSPGEVPVYRPRVTSLPDRTPPVWARREAPDGRVIVPPGSMRPMPGDRRFDRRDGDDRRPVAVPPGTMRPGPGDDRRFDRPVDRDRGFGRRNSDDRPVTVSPAPMRPQPEDRRFERRGGGDVQPDRRQVPPAVVQPAPQPRVAPPPVPQPSREVRREGGAPDRSRGGSQGQPGQGPDRQAPDRQGPERRGPGAGEPRG